MKKMFFAILFLFLVSTCYGQTITTTTVADKTSFKKNTVITVTTTIKNASTVVSDVLVATGTYTDSDNATQTTVSSPCNLTVIHPATVITLTVPFSGSLQYVIDSAKLDGISVIPSVTATILTIPLSKILYDQDICNVTYQFRAK